MMTKKMMVMMTKKVMVVMTKKVMVIMTKMVMVMKIMMIMDGLVTKGVHKDRAANKAKFFQERGEPDHYV